MNEQTNPYFQQPAQENENYYLQLVDTIDTISIIENMLRNKVQKTNPETGAMEWVQQGKPKMNEEGIAEVLRIISSEFDKNTFLSAYSEERVMAMMRHTMHYVIYSLGQKYKEYDLDPRDFQLLRVQIGNILESAYRRAIGMMTLKQLMGRERSIQSYQRIKEDSGAGLFSFGRPRRE